MKKETLSKLMSLALRHKPQEIGIQLDHQGWTSLSDLHSAIQTKHPEVTVADIMNVVATCPKQRFAVDEEGQMIRANQGHSIKVDLALPIATPPERLFHGTASRFIESIRRDGLQARQRHHVHLTASRETAMTVGARRGTAYLLQIDAKQMHEDGYHFYLSENQVWLTDVVPAKYIIELEEQ
ncbi:RNA 2'-phosphotransferase [Undibacterium cyanobacteriorum]|uniref:Probable RNA 2'-phosphotransferase n=1 Tax=Undibacterium cyanobacteriorum TaxID=3073561 RepID=A0ABY9RJ48_9BURK|nr:RNA 2'-phosphotransferase [Undibacterium sp. 20NA77.5]WMW80305.1 RNA 2'-phosphotransferase [Undibacterium sp. 20NA77.5]